MKTLKSRLAGGALALAIAVGCAVAPATAASANTGSTGKGCTAYQYSSGGYSTCVGYIQRMLNGISSSRNFGGYQLAVDNSFGANTNTNVRRFQSYLGLTSDGIVGANTWYQLCRYAGTRSFGLANATALQKSAWNAAYEAGCYVDVPVGPAGIKVISKY